MLFQRSIQWQVEKEGEPHAAIILVLIFSNEINTLRSHP